MMPRRRAKESELRKEREGPEVDSPPTGRSPIEPPEVQVVRTRRISCDGGEGALGHPRVWMTIPEEGFVDCGYCDKRFVLADGAGGH